jgi:hypothetical protein
LTGTAPCIAAWWTLPSKATVSSGRISPLALSVVLCRTAQAPGITVYHISVDDHVVIAAEHDLMGSLRGF